MVSTSIVIIESSVKALVKITGGVAAVTDVVSDISIVSFVDKIDTPF